MRVLGIDCGSERTGWGVIESDGRQHSVWKHRLNAVIRDLLRTSIVGGRVECQQLRHFPRVAVHLEEPVDPERAEVHP